MEQQTFWVGLGVAIVAAFLPFIKVPPPVAAGFIALGIVIAAAAACHSWLRSTHAQTALYAVGFGLIVAGIVWQVGTEKPTTSSPAAGSSVQPTSQARVATLSQITQLYVLSHDGISSRMLAGMELPPVDFINAELERQRATWRVRNTEGANAETYDLRR